MAILIYSLLKEKNPMNTNLKDGGNYSTEQTKTLGDSQSKENDELTGNGTMPLVKINDLVPETTQTNDSGNISTVNGKSYSSSNSKSENNVVEKNELSQETINAVLEDAVCCEFDTDLEKLEETSSKEEELAKTKEVEETNQFLISNSSKVHKHLFGLIKLSDDELKKEIIKESKDIPKKRISAILEEISDEEQQKILDKKKKPDIHPILGIYPEMNHSKKLELELDLYQNGLIDPIIIDSEYKIIDGRTRLEICLKLGIEPKFQKFNGDIHEIFRLTKSKNLARKHYSASQLAATVAEIYQYYLGNNLENRDEFLKSLINKTDSNYNNNDKTRDILGVMFGVSGRYISDACNLKEYDENLFYKVKNAEKYEDKDKSPLTLSKAMNLLNKNLDYLFKVKNKAKYEKVWGNITEDDYKVANERIKDGKSPIQIVKDIIDIKVLEKESKSNSVQYKKKKKNINPGKLKLNRERIDLFNKIKDALKIELIERARNQKREIEDYLQILIKIEDKNNDNEEKKS
jgi:hypothetical protein